MYREFAGGAEEISLELAQAIMFGSIKHAARLGFNPIGISKQSVPILARGMANELLTLAIGVSRFTSTVPMMI
ncbi:hypothetical protein OsccyDRAFT_2438 [Leptolyngbyaceae cyanobacterium JSC-12]|nr:hypothetical protein OsccyDRAFT_2438 [Leptolyngbyaceae cyanobacterium JSC-12]